MNCFLRMGEDHLNCAMEFFTIGDAKHAFLETARDLDRYDQRIEASIHIADSVEELSEYPDYVLSLGPRGGLKCERA